MTASAARQAAIATRLMELGIPLLAYESEADTEARIRWTSERRAGLPDGITWEVAWDDDPTLSDSAHTEKLRKLTAAG